MDNNEKDEKLKNLVKNLCEEKDLSDSQDQIIKTLKNIYTEQYRHKYSQLTDTILKSAKQDKEQTFMILAQNMRIIAEFIKEKQNENIKVQLEKLYEHINLECIRLQDIDEKIEKLKIASNELERLNKKYKFLEGNLNKQQTQYITILGIFASIVLAFVGGLVFSTSVLSNIDKVSIYRLIFVIAFIALFFGNILYFLFNFLSKIAIVQKQEKQEWWKYSILWFNIVCIIIILIGFFGEIKLDLVEVYQYFLTSQKQS